MFTSPLLFEKLGWKGVASATPNFMMWAGVPFFAGCVLYNALAGEAGQGRAGQGSFEGFSRVEPWG